MGRQGVTGNLAGGRQDPDRNGQVIPPALFRQVGRGQVHGDPAYRKLEMIGQQRTPDAFPAFLDLGLGQSDDVKFRQAGRDVYIDGDLQ